MEFSEAARIAQLGYTDIEVENTIADVQHAMKETKQKLGYWACPVCKERFPVNHNGFAVTCACVK